MKLFWRYVNYALIPHTYLTKLYYLQLPPPIVKITHSKQLFSFYLIHISSTHNHHNFYHHLLLLLHLDASAYANLHRSLVFCLLTHFKVDFIAPVHLYSDRLLSLFTMAVQFSQSKFHFTQNQVATTLNNNFPSN